AGFQGFLLKTSCLDCTLSVASPEGERVEKKISDLRSEDLINFPTGKGMLKINKIDLYSDPDYVPTTSDRFVLAARALLIPKYAFLFIPTVAVGLLAFFFSFVVFRNEALKNSTFIFAATAWILTLSRAGLLIVSSSIWIHILNSEYLSPAYFTLAAAAILAAPADVQLTRLTPCETAIAATFARRRLVA